MVCNSFDCGTAPGHLGRAKLSCLTWSSITIGKSHHHYHHYHYYHHYHPMFLYNLKLFNTMSTVLYDIARRRTTLYDVI